MNAPYDDLAPAYQKMFSDDDSLMENAFLFARLGYQGGSVLDVGCGDGLFLEYCNPDEYLGIDPSVEMLRRLLMRHQQRVMIAKFEQVQVGRWDLIVALFGSASYVDPAAWSGMPGLLKGKGRYFLMFYADGYTPKTHAHISRPPMVYAPDRSTFANATFEPFGDYIIVEGQA